jgi:LytS/YehU family sensor histidine kinase
MMAPFYILKGFSMKTRNYLHNYLLKLVLASLFLALAYVMPFLTGQIPEIGSMLCPMHLPVLLCGFICGPVWGGVVGFVAPLFRSLTLGMPPLFPTALCMAFELAAYGAVSGLLHKLLPKKKPYIYCSLLAAMISGRLIWGAAMFIFVGASGGSFTLTAFLAGAITNAIPGIIVQIALVPLLVMLLDNPKILKMRG